MSIQHTKFLATLSDSGLTAAGMSIDGQFAKRANRVVFGPLTQVDAVFAAAHSLHVLDLVRLGKGFLHAS